MKSTPVPAVEITKDNEHEFVTTNNCHLCPEDSGCTSLLDSKGDYICMCYHFGKEPLRKGTTCRRKTVTRSSLGTYNSFGHWPSVDHNPSVIPVHVLTNSTTREMLDGIPPKGHYISTAMITALLGVFIFTTVVTMVLCFVKRKALRRLLRTSSFKSKREMMEPSSGNILLPIDRFVSNPTYATTCVDLSIRVFSSEEIVLTTQIGQGCFGKVYKGNLNGEEVAVKLVNNESSDEAMKEIETMASFSHPNILHLMGIVKKSDIEAPWLLFEFMEHGDLVSVLRNSSQTYPLSPLALSLSLASDGEQTAIPTLELNTDTLMDFALQISEGMSYLSSQHFVHRDLAARNCLVSKNLKIKISDFGLSRDVYTCDYYKVGGSKLLPLRWMAPESILYGRFTIESDIWAYGVLLWEIFTWGKQPHYGHSNEEVVQLIIDGVLLCPPSECSPIVSQIMASCWKTEPKERMRFKQISQKLVNKDDSGKNLDSNPIRSNRLRRPVGSGSYSRNLESAYEVPESIHKIEYMDVV